MRPACVLALTVLTCGLRLPACLADTSQPQLEVTGVPARVFASGPLTFGISLRGLEGAEAEVEVSTLLADRVLGQTLWKVPLADGSGTREVPLNVPETRTRVSLDIVAKIKRVAPPVTARVRTTILPRWSADRLADVLRTREIAVVERDAAVAGALGNAPFEKISPANVLGIESFRGDLLVCRFPQFALASEGAVAALAGQLRQGRSVLWLTPSHEQMPRLLHSAQLLEVRWPFVLRPGRELAAVPPEDTAHWPGTESALPAPLLSFLAGGRLIVCSERVVTDLSREPAAGWIWEAILAWAAKPVDPPPPVRRLGFDGAQFPSSLPGPKADPVAALLSLDGEDWVQPDEQHVEWLERVGRFVEEGNALIVTGADADRMTALRALGLPPMELSRLSGPADLLLAPNLVLWGIAKVDPSSGLLTPKGGKPLAQVHVGGQVEPRLFAEFKLGKGILLLCQPDFDQAATGAGYPLVEHLARQLLGPAGRCLLEESER